MGMNLIIKVIVTGHSPCTIRTDGSMMELGMATCQKIFIRITVKCVVCNDEFIINIASPIALQCRLQKKKNPLVSKMHRLPVRCIVLGNNVAVTGGAPQMK